RIDDEDGRGDAGFEGFYVQTGRPVRPGWGRPTGGAATSDRGSQSEEEKRLDAGHSGASAVRALEGHADRSADGDRPQGPRGPTEPLSSRTQRVCRLASGRPMGQHRRGERGKEMTRLGRHLPLFRLQAMKRPGHERLCRRASAYANGTGKGYSFFVSVR